MEFLEGDSLADLVTEKRLPFSQVNGLALQICKGLEAIHAADVIHRDLKPGNIFVTSSQVAKIMDFGIARSEDSNLTAHGEMLGSAGYMAPEIWLGKNPTTSVDLYALGVIFYEMATGELPYMSKSAAALMRHHLDTKPVPPVDKNPEISPELNELILRLLAKDPSQRPQSTTEVISFLQQGNYEINLTADPLQNKLPRVTGETLDTSAVLGKDRSFQRPDSERKGFPVIPIVGSLLILGPLLYLASSMFSGSEESNVVSQPVEKVVTAKVDSNAKTDIEAPKTVAATNKQEVEAAPVIELSLIHI